MADLSEAFRRTKHDRGARTDDVDVDFGAGAIRLPRSTKVLDLRPAKRGLVPADGPVRWSALDALPQLRTLEWAGPARGIVEAIADHPTVKFLYWFDAEGDVDLTATGLGTVRIDGVRLRSVRLPTSVGGLLLGRPPAQFDSMPPTATVRKTLHVDAPDAGQRLDLRLCHYGSDVVIPDGLRRASQLWLRVGGDVSATVLSKMTDLETLRLTLDRPPGTISDLPELRQHAMLNGLQLDEAYGLAAQDLPELPALRTLELNGTRRATATAVKSRYRGSAVTVSTWGAKTDQWLALHMDNPFRDWVHDSKAFGQAACAAYNRVRHAAEVLVAHDPDRLTAAERLLRELVADLNAIDEKFHMIDTLRREQAWDAYYDLAQEHGVPRAQAETWFDEERRF